MASREIQHDNRYLKHQLPKWQNNVAKHVYSNQERINQLEDKVKGQSEKNCLDFGKEYSAQFGYKADLCVSWLPVWTSILNGFKKNMNISLPFHNLFCSAVQLLVLFNNIGISRIETIEKNTDWNIPFDWRTINIKVSINNREFGNNVISAELFICSSMKDKRTWFNPLELFDEYMDGANRHGYTYLVTLGYNKSNKIWHIKSVNNRQRNLVHNGLVPLAFWSKKWLGIRHDNPQIRIVHYYPRYPGNWTNPSNYVYAERGRRGGRGRGGDGRGRGRGGGRGGRGRGGNGRGQRHQRDDRRRYMDRGGRVSNHEHHGHRDRRDRSRSRNRSRYDGLPSIISIS